VAHLTSSETIHRHRTAMVRHELSQPMALMARHNLVKPGVRVFDYGCGQGDDLRILNASGIEADGWDPYFRPQSERLAAPVVNLGFVLNVIENPLERRDALAGAWALTERVLSIATMIAGQSPVGGLRPHGDGYLTSRGTFQKYFLHAELGAFIAQVLGTSPVAAAPGIFLVFRTPEDEQEFLLSRRAGRRSATYRLDRPDRHERRLRPAVPERIPLTLVELADFMRHRGRIPQLDELGAPATQELAEQRVSLARAVEACLEHALSRADLYAAAATRSEDLLVHHALGLLNRSASVSRPSPAMVRDIRAHFGGHKELATRAMGYLKALADEDHVREAMRAAASDGLGLLDHRERLVADGSRAEELPGVLRCYFGCATFLAGEPAGDYLLRIDAGRKRVTLWPITNPTDPLPQTDHSIRIDLRRQDVSVRPDRRRLLRKGDLFGMSAKSKQRRLEAEHRERSGLLADQIFERLEA
jgi:DNA phosphorothioation-associated putative methyltransferase